MRTIKFRAWDKDHNRMIGGEWLEIRHDDVAVLNEEGDYSFPNLELMQFTGLQDKNGVDIYEGDICNQLLLRKFGEEENPRYVGEVTFQPSSGYIVGSEGIWPNDIEVIGNIYENKELLK